ncbi:hypothetical protein VCHA54P500_80161 [Vibrio chagasii]|nr:hypothetical protein VCHA34P117_80160 [Vibrio chagasii]CAH7326022.1 hypothetical protein VCHA48P439_80039 [Vibrio chagasii]CAH7363167.1 hypothetical protein VCHA40O236_80150 [Vibrio chagasii]CAH7411413.1 hypothetical protein VCHA54P500_80161 [Vibrio chagasii]CAH7476232.1 hypothetical protein VCHA53O462_80039 [Vibrio chagasii]
MCLHTVCLIRMHYPQIVFIINLVEWFKGEKSRYGMQDAGKRDTRYEEQNSRCGIRVSGMRKE